MAVVELGVMHMLNASLEWLTLVLDFPSSRAVVFGVHIGGHLFLEALLLIVILFLLSQKSYKPPKKPLSNKEIDELCDDWVPEPLIPPIDKEMQHELPTLESAAGPHTMINGKEVVNFTSANYLGLIGHEKLLESCTTALEKYGVGSCGPRGFYGTIDVHLDCEERIAKFLNTSDSILYSYGLSTMFSAIPCFCKKGDVIVVDEGVHWGIQNGLYLSRSTVVYYKHNDMESLRKILEKITAENKRVKKLRRYIVVEAVYQIAKIGIITAAMGHALATEGGFCTGSARVIDHQRLSSSGYVFSASLPPYLASAAITAIDILEDSPSLMQKLRDNIAVLWKGLSNVEGLSIVSDRESPIVFLKLQKSTGSLKGDLQLLEDIADRAPKENCVFVATSKRSTLDKCCLPVGIRLFVSAALSESDLLKAIECLKRVSASIVGA